MPVVHMVLLLLPQYHGVLCLVPCVDLVMLCKHVYPFLQVILCHNHLIGQQEVNHALTHELLHAYDHCRGANIDWHNCNHHACSEIRAASLSGDCNWKQELLRGNYGIRKQHQVCVKRRAELSLSMNPSCQGLRGKMAVDAVFDSCYQDTAPFDRIP